MKAPFRDSFWTFLIDIYGTLGAEYRIKQALGYACRVAFDPSGGGEIRIFFRNKKDLEGIIEPQLL